MVIQNLIRRFREWVQTYKDNHSSTPIPVAKQKKDSWGN